MPVTDEKRNKAMPDKQPRKRINVPTHREEKPRETKEQQRDREASEKMVDEGDPNQRPASKS